MDDGTPGPSLPGHDAGEESMSLAFPQNLDLVIHDTRISTFQEAIDMITACDTQEAKIEICAELGTALVDIANSAQYLLVKFHEFVKKELSEAEQKTFSSKTWNFDTEAKKAKGALSKRSAINSLERHKGAFKKTRDGDEIPACPRKTLLVEYILGDALPASGANCYSNLASLLEKKSAKELIGYLNNSIILRNKNVSAYRVVGIRPTDIAKALDNRQKMSKKKKGGERFQIEDVKLSDLKKLGLRFHACGLLEPGKFDPKAVFPAVPGETEDLDLIIGVEDDLEQGADPEAPADASAAAVESTLDTPATADTTMQEGEPAATPSTPIGNRRDKPETRQLTPTPAEQRQIGEGIPVTPARPKRTAKEANLSTPTSVKKGKKGSKGFRGSKDSKYNKNRGSTTRGDTSKHNLPMPAIDIDCECPTFEKDSKINIAWQIKLHDFHLISYALQRTVLEPIVEFGRLTTEERGDSIKMPCAVHVEELCDMLGMVYEPDEEEMADRFVAIFDMTIKRSSFRIPMLHTRTRDWFDPEDEYVAQTRRECILRHKYTPKSAPKVPINPAYPIPEWYKAFNDLERQEVIESSLNKWTLDAEVHPLLCKEFEMLLWHSQSNLPRLGNISGAYYTIASQAVHANPWLWYHHFVVTQEKWFLWHPQPALYFKAGVPVNARDYYGAFDFSTSRGILGFMCLRRDPKNVKLADGTKNPDYEAHHVQVFRHQERSRLHDFAKAELESQEFIALNEPQNTVFDDRFVEEGKLGKLREVMVSCDLDEGSTLLLRDGCVVRRNWDKNPNNEDTTGNSLPLAEPRIEIPISLVQADHDGETENRVSVTELRFCVMDHEKPPQARFEDCPEPAFPITVKLENLGPIWEMVRGASRSDDPSVVAEMIKWATLGPNELRGLRQAWETKAKAEVIRAYDVLVEREKKAYGKNSYFYHLKHLNDEPEAEGVAAPFGPAEPDVVVISDDEEEAPNRHRTLIAEQEAAKIESMAKRELARLKKAKGMPQKNTGFVMPEELTDAQAAEYEAARQEAEEDMPSQQEIEEQARRQQEDKRPRSSVFEEAMRTPTDQQIATDKEQEDALVEAAGQLRVQTVQQLVQEADEERLAQEVAQRAENERIDSIIERNEEVELDKGVQQGLGGNEEGDEEDEEDEDEDEEMADAIEAAE